MTSPLDEYGEEFSAYLAELNSAVTQFGRDCVTPIFRAGNDLRPRPLGTGFVVGAEGRYFLVTAAHVVDELDNDYSLHISSPSKKLIPVEGILNKIDTPAVGGRDRDQIDFAFLELHHDIGFTQDNSFDASLLAERHEKDGIMVLLGYPASRNRNVNVKSQNIRTSLHTYIAREGDVKRLAKEGAQPGHHIVLERDIKSLRSTSNVEPDLHALNGMSGGPILSLPLDWEPGKKFLLESTPISLRGMFIEDHSRTHALLLGVKSDLLLRTINAYLYR